MLGRLKVISRALLSIILQLAAVQVHDVLTIMTTMKFRISFISSNIRLVRLPNHAATFTQSSKLKSDFILIVVVLDH